MDLQHPASLTLLAFLESEISQNRAGDYQTMLRALWNKRENPDLHQTSTTLPKGYRSRTVREYVREKFGALLLQHLRRFFGALELNSNYVPSGT